MDRPGGRAENPPGVVCGLRQLVRITYGALGEPLSVIPLTVRVQRIALELSEARGVDPDRFRFEQDPRRERVD